MIFKEGVLTLNTHDFDHITGHMSDDEMTLREAFEREVSLMGLTLDSIYSVETSLGLSKEHMELFSHIVSQIDFGLEEVDRCEWCGNKVISGEPFITNTGYFCSSECALEHYDTEIEKYEI